MKRESRGLYSISKSTLGPGCPHSKHGWPAQCSLCLGVKVTRIDPIELTKKWAEGFTHAQKLDALDKLIGEEEPSAIVEAKDEEDDLFAPA